MVVIVVAGIAIEVGDRTVGIVVRNALVGHLGHGVQDQQLFPEGALRLHGRDGSESKVTAIRQFVGDVGGDFPLLDGNGVWPGTALYPYRRLDVAVSGSEGAVITNDENVERILVSIAIETEPDGKMILLADRILDRGNFLQQLLSERTGNVLPRSFVDLLGESFLLLVDGGERGNVSFKRDVEIGLIYPDVDVFGKPSDEAICLAQAGSALEVEMDRIVLASVEQEIEDPAYVEVFLNIFGAGLQLGGDRRIECPPFVYARAKDFSEGFMHGSLRSQTALMMCPILRRPTAFV